MSPRVVEKAPCDLPPVTSSLFSTLSATAEVDQFVCYLYGAPDVTGGRDEARRAFFELVKSLESLTQLLTPLNYTYRQPITKPKYGFRQTDATCHWDVQQTQEDGRKQTVS